MGFSIVFPHRDDLSRNPSLQEIAGNASRVRDLPKEISRLIDAEWLNKTSTAALSLFARVPGRIMHTFEDTTVSSYGQVPRASYVESLRVQANKKDSR